MKVRVHRILVAVTFLIILGCLAAKPKPGILLSDDLVHRLVELAPEIKQADLKVLKAVSFDVGVESFLYLEISFAGLPHAMGGWTGSIIVKSHFRYNDWSNAEIFTLKKPLSHDEIRGASEKSMREVLDLFAMPFP